MTFLPKDASPIERAHHEGRMAAQAGRSLRGNPYGPYGPVKPELFYAWRNGWFEADDEMNEAANTDWRCV